MLNLVQRMASAGFLAVGIVLATFALPVVAQTNEQPNSPIAQASPLPTPTPTAAPYLTGDWGGERTRLAQEGVTFRGARVDMKRHEFRFSKAKHPKGKRVRG